MLARPLLAVVVASVVAAWSVLDTDPRPSGTVPVAEAAKAWLDSLSPALRTKAQRALDDAQRTDWHFVPKQRTGVSLKEMDTKQRRAAHALLRSALSTEGYLKAKAVMELEAVLFELESRPNRPATHRDPELYWFLVFGDPSSGKPWAWRVEGHHLSLNFTVVKDEVMAFAPSFWGANPGEVRDGRHAGLRVLAEEEDLARKLLLSMSEEQRKTAKISDRAPRDIILTPGKDATALKAPHGIVGKDLKPAQRKVLTDLIRTHARGLRAPSYDREMGRIDDSGGIDVVRFGWAGSPDPGEGHYYRIVGPTFIVEYDNVQNGANHIHVVWRDPKNDFGAALLR